MKTIKLENIEWIESPNRFKGRTAKVSAIVIHWWDDPAKRPSISGVINTFKNPATEVSAHFIVSGDRVVQMVNMADTAWHARQANPFTVGIEVDPNTPGNTYETVGALVKFIRGYYPGIPLKRHSDYVATSCPGTLDIGRIDAIAKGTYTPPVTTPTKPLYRVYKGTVQVGAYSVEKNAYNAYKTKSATKIELNGKDVTSSLVAKYEPKPAPQPTTPEPYRDDELHSKVDKANGLLAQILALLTKIFK